MIYFYRKPDGGFQMVSDQEDREVARLLALEEGMDPDDTLGCLLDTAQIAARKAGLLVTAWDRGEVEPKAVFPHGPFCIPTPLMNGDMDAEVERIKAGWHRARIRITPAGAYCTPILPRRRIAR